MNRTPEFPRQKSRTLKPSLFGDFEDSKKVFEEKKKLNEKKEPETENKKSEERKKRNLDNMKKLRIELDKQIEMKQNIIENSLLRDKNLDQIIGSEIFSKLQIKENKDKVGSMNDGDKTALVKAWVQEQKSKELKMKFSNMAKTPAKSKKSLAPVIEVRRSATPISAPNPNLTKTITRQISNTIKKARELRSIISKSPSPVLYH